MIRRALLLALFMMLPMVAGAQCIPQGGGYATIAACPDAVDFQPTDYILAMQRYNGTTITQIPGSTRKVTPNQLAQLIGGSGGSAGSPFNSAFPASGDAIGAKNGPNLVPLNADGSGNLLVSCANCSGGGGGSSGTQIDQAAFSSGITPQTPVGGFFQTTPTNNALVSGQGGAFQVTSTRALFINLRNASGTELGVAAAPLQVSLANTAANGTSLAVLSTQAGTWTNTVTQATGTNLHIVCDSGCSSSTAPSDEAAFTFGTTPQSPVGGVFQTTATSNPLTTGQMGAFQVTANRALFTNLRNAAGAEIATAAVPLQVSLANTAANGTAVAVTLPANQSVNLAQVAGATISQGHGTAATGIRVELPTDGTGTVGLIAGSALVGKVDILGNLGGVLDFPGQNASSPANAMLVGCQSNTSPTGVSSGNSTPVQCDAAANVKVNVNAALPAGTNTIGAVTVAAATSGGETAFREIVPANTTSVAIKASAGQLYDLDGFSVPASTAPVFVKFYNAAQGSTTCGSGTPILGPYMIPAGGTGFVKSWASGIAFSTAITMCVTGGQADADATAPTAAQYTISAGWK